MFTTVSVKTKLYRNTWAPVCLAAFSTFTTYFCMYGFRKPITATTFDNQAVLGISFKSALIIAQVLGYMTSKFVGIKFISELDKSKRTKYILLLLGSSHISLLLLALVPRPFNVTFLFINGLCLGLIWGIVFSYIEGRKFTDMLALILSTNFIFSSGVAKSLGRMLIENWKVPEIYMPFVAGILYIPLLILAVWLLGQIPTQSNEEIKSRGNRTVLNGRQRLALMSRFFTGLAAITVLNLSLTILRDLKDNYAVEILRTLKPGFNPDIFARMESLAALSVLGLLLLLTGFKNHFKSIQVHHFTIGCGLILLLASAWFLQQSIFNPVINLVTYTIGLYVCYNTLQCLFLDRFLASFKIKGNIGFFFYFMDAIGYLGSCFIILNKEIFSPRLNWLSYFINISYVLGSIGIVSITASWVYFQHKHKQQTHYNNYLNAT